jgi:rhodanese-related sulfurtransferase
MSCIQVNRGMHQFFWETICRRPVQLHVIPFFSAFKPQLYHKCLALLQVSDSFFVDNAPVQMQKEVEKILKIIKDLFSFSQAHFLFQDAFMTFELSTPMQLIEQQLPFSKALLHSQFHVGGCSACGFEPSETLFQVASKHGKNANDMLFALNKALSDAKNAQFSPEHLGSLVAKLHGAETPLLIDVREPWEFEICHLPEAVLLNESNMDEVVKKIENAKLSVVYCHHGVRSLNAALYFRSQGYLDVYSLQGGVDLYSRVVDTSLARY